jgi:hypothetical protein
VHQHAAPAGHPPGPLVQGQSKNADLLLEPAPVSRLSGKRASVLAAPRARD